MTDVPQQINVVALRDVPQSDLDRIKAVDPERINVTGIWRGMRDDLLKSFPADQVKRFERTTDPVPPPPPEEMARIISEAHVLYSGAIHPSDLYDRMPSLRWVQFTFAGLSSIRHSKFWKAPITMTSSRGVTGALPIAEMALVGGLMIAKGLHVAVRQTDAGALEPKAFAPSLTAGKTIGIIGLGGIGGNLARLAKAMGLRVLGTKRSATARATDTDGVDELYPTSQMHEMLGECDYVGVCAPLTTETEGMLDAATIEAMKAGAIIMNIARGELFDEDALASALANGHLGGAYLDVFSGEEQGRPAPEYLTSLPNVVMTPHISFRSDVPQMFSMNLFLENLRKFLDGEQLTNVVDFDRGY